MSIISHFKNKKKTKSLLINRCFRTLALLCLPSYYAINSEQSQPVFCLARPALKSAIEDLKPYKHLSLNSHFQTLLGLCQGWITVLLVNLALLDEQVFLVVFLSSYR